MRKVMKFVSTGALVISVISSILAFVVLTELKTNATNEDVVLAVFLTLTSLVLFMIVSWLDRKKKKEISSRK